MAFPPNLLAECWFLAGPTASGKTSASLRLAEKINAEIVALDSMTLYRGMDIGTAKPSIAERSAVQHHLIDILDPEEEYSLADYLQAAETACCDIISRGRKPLFVGGAGLYLRGLLRGVFDGPPANWSIRQRFESLASEFGSQALWDRLQVIDPLTAKRLHPNDQRRIIRALEVFELTGKPLSAFQTQGPRTASEQPNHVYWISPPRDWLYGRIDQRVEQMFEEGLMDEVRYLMSRTPRMSHTARQALGYKEIIDLLESDSSSSDKDDPRAVIKPAADTIQTRTRQFAKRQHTWFRNLEECRPIAITGSENASEIADMVIQASQTTIR